MGRFVDFFRERVTRWKNILSVVEVNLKLWLQVQHLWVSLESIFMNSSDIRSQLPDDTKRFVDIDDEFRILMRAIATNPLVVDVCTEVGREEILRDMVGELEKCQKSLNECVHPSAHPSALCSCLNDVLIYVVLHVQCRCGGGGGGFGLCRMNPRYCATFSCITTYN